VRKDLNGITLCTRLNVLYVSVKINEQCSGVMCCNSVNCSKHNKGLGFLYLLSNCLLFCSSRNPLELYTFRLLNNDSCLIQMCSKEHSIYGRVFDFIKRNRYAGLIVFYTTDPVFSIWIEEGCV
jgi:hypothetical protein